METIFRRPNDPRRRGREGFQRRVAVPHQDTVGPCRELHVQSSEKLGGDPDTRVDRPQYVE